MSTEQSQVLIGSTFDAPAVLLLIGLGWLSGNNMIEEETSTMIYKSLNSLTPSISVNFLKEFLVCILKT